MLKNEKFLHFPGLLLGEYNYIDGATAAAIPQSLETSKRAFKARISI
jgi:hypothetical protein